MIAAAATSPALVFVTLLGACVWVGGLVAIAVVARIARRTLERPVQVPFFRALGRSYGVVGGSALFVALAGGAALLADHHWDGTALAAILVATALVLVTAAGVTQARGMTRLRQRALREPGDRALAAAVRRGTLRAGGLRAAMAALSIALLAIAVALMA